MVARRVILTVTEGSHRGQQFILDRPAHCAVGRAPDCSVHLAGKLEDCLVSRHHCQVDVEEPCVRVHDLGSRNGTFVNGRRIPGTESDFVCEHDTKVIPRELELKDGDEVRVGPIPFRVTLLETVKH
jgi:pSer/pThr/pTyr-binding forkhead associated (FHA) protein